MLWTAPPALHRPYFVLNSHCGNIRFPGSVECSANVVLHDVQAGEAKAQLEAELQAVQQQQRTSAAGRSSGGGGGDNAVAAQLRPRVPSPQEDVARQGLRPCHMASTLE